jgi:hypothetical protein
MKDIIDVDSWVNKYEIDQEHDNMYYSRSWLEVDQCHKYAIDHGYKLSKRKEWKLWIFLHNHIERIHKLEALQTH